MKKIVAIVAIAFVTLLSFGADSETDSLKSQNDQLRGEIRKANDQISTLKSSLATSETNNTQLQADLDKANHSIEILTNVIDRLKVPAEVPVRVSTRKALTGDGEVIIFQNLADKTLAVKVKLENAGLGTQKDLVLYLPAPQITGGVKEIGHLEGWVSTSGDKVSIVSEGYVPIVRTVK